MVNEFEVDANDSKETSYYLNSDKINDLYVHSILNDEDFNPVIAC